MGVDSDRRDAGWRRGQGGARLKKAEAPGESMWARSPGLWGRAREALTIPGASCILAGGMRRLSTPLVLGILTAFSVLAPGAAHADPRTSFLVEQLKSEDYRVRTQAALALGASGDDGAVQPLCDALKDAKASVKTAAADALGKLGKPAGLPCLQAAEAKEFTPAVKSQITKSITALRSVGTPGALQPPPPPSKDAKYYIAIEVTNKTGRPITEVEPLMRAAMQTKLLAQKGYAVAPKGEAPGAGGQIVKSRKLKGFLLMAVVEPPVYEGGDLKQVVRLTVASYPGKSIKGEFSLKLTQSNTAKGDKKSEDLLMKMIVESAIDNFLKAADTL